MEKNGNRGFAIQCLAAANIVLALTARRYNWAVVTSVLNNISISAYTYVMVRDQK